MKKLIALMMILLASGKLLVAEEGMYIPMLLEQTVFGKMKEMGLKLSADDIYSINNSSLKDAIVMFGGGCTAEIVSPKGLILTNHHCGLGAIQRLSTLENDYLANGFWAPTMAGELPCPGITVTLLVRMEEVTDQVLKGVTDEMNQLQRNVLIRQNIATIEKESVKGSHYEARIRPFYYGNQYYLLVNEVFKDVRLVGAPPNSIGQFGGDTDNWMWPRHTGDFSVFRIYAGPDNKPAAYSTENVPYTPRKHLPVSLKGYDKGDFTFVFGYPGTTREYLTSAGVDFLANKENPLRIGLRQLRLDIMKTAMEESRQVRIQYTAKANGIANFWKKMIGESRGIRRANAIEIKKAEEEQFLAWCKGDASRNRKYGEVIESLKKTYETNLPVNEAYVYFSEAAMGIETIRFAAGFRELIRLSSEKKHNPEEWSKALSSVRRSAADFYKNWNAAIDEKVMAVMLSRMHSGMDVSFRPLVIDKVADENAGNFQRYSRRVFEKSVFTDSSRMFNLLSGLKPSHAGSLKKDPVYRLMEGMYADWDTKILPGIQRFSGRIDSLQRIYMAAQMEMDRKGVLYPDANGTLRVAFGKVDDYRPADAVKYFHFTTLEGVLQKEDTAVYDYHVDPRLKRLHESKDYGQYADKDGHLHVAFTASNHTTGGNSGSPVLNAEGHLIGINFDRNWEGTLSDLHYDPEQCRNIALDIRYCLFVIDKLCGNGHLVREMTIVN